jgi:hypothetical protein
MQTETIEYLENLANANTALHLAEADYETAKEELHDSDAWQDFVQAKNDRTIARDILAGMLDKVHRYVQTPLPLDTTVQTVFDHVAEQINSGVMDTPGVTVRATTQTGACL